MEVHYELSLADVAAYQSAVKRRVVARARRAERFSSRLLVLCLVAAYLALSALAVWALPQWTGRMFSEAEFMAGLAIGMLAVFAASWLDYFRHRAHVVKSGGPTLSPHTLNLEPGGLRFAGNNFENTYLWSIFESVEEAGPVIVLWLEPAMGLTVPRSAFANVEDAKAFAERVREEIRLSRETHIGRAAA